MRNVTIMCVLAMAFLWEVSADAALRFEADFAGDNVYDISWPMKTGEVVAVDIYVSNVPAAGLIAMGFTLSYDPGKLSVEDAAVDEANWPHAFGEKFVDTASPGEVHMAGWCLDGLAGNGIRLGTVTLRCIEEGTSELTLLDRDGQWFVLYTAEGPPIDLDGDIGTGVLLAAILPPTPGDVTGDGTVDLADAILALETMSLLQQHYVHANADVTGDVRIGMPEVIYILQKISNLR